jgi:hypothetical protein
MATSVAALAALKVPAGRRPGPRKAMIDAAIRASGARSGRKSSTGEFPLALHFSVPGYLPFPPANKKYIVCSLSFAMIERYE